MNLAEYKKLHDLLYEPKIGSHAICVTPYSEVDNMTTGNFALVTNFDERTRMMTLLLDEREVKMTLARGQRTFIFSPVTENLKGKSFCITGALLHPRAAIEVFIQLNSGEHKNTMNGSVSYLVTNNIGMPSTKMQKAAKLGITTINESEFLGLCYFGPKSLEK